MGLPSIVITFKEKGITAIQRGQRGIMAMILKEATIPEKNKFVVYSTTDIPETLGEFNKKQIELALMGYQTPPKKIICYIINKSAEDYKEAQLYLETVRFDYVVIPEIKDDETTSFASWIKAMRDTKDIRVKAVLPHEPADHEGIVNFDTTTIKTKGKDFTTAEYCSRIAGMITGTPMTISCTFAPLGEVLEIEPMTKEEYDTAVEAGKLLLYNDGEKIKIARGVNSFITPVQSKLDSFKKIKIVDAMDMIHDDIKKTAEDSYLGKYANSYDNKCLLILAIQAYFEQLELDGILEKGKNSVYIDVEQQRVYLKSIGTIGVDEMTDQEVKEANTKDKVFLAAEIKILDAIEEIKLAITI